MNTFLSKFDNFITEQVIISSINENSLDCTTYFLNRISSIESKSKVAKVLHTVFRDTYYINNLSQNYIDIDPEEDDKISFISDAKADSFGNYIYQEKGRGTIKIGRFVRAFFNDKKVIKDLISSKSFSTKDLSFTDKEIEDFVNLYKATASIGKNTFKLVKGQAIKKWYSEESHSESRSNGNLANSCMNDASEGYFDIYSENTEACNLLILTDSKGKLLGRALVWKLHESPCNAKYFMDRVYTFADSDVVKFTNYAGENGWMYKFKMNSTLIDSLSFYYNEKPVFGKILVKLRKAIFEEYPYLDTLSFLDQDKKMLSNVGFYDGLVLQDTSGEALECDECDGKGINCRKCDNEKVIECPDCSDYNTHGSGYLGCGDCDETGDDGSGKCKSCKSTGKIKCKTCDGKGEIKCDQCESSICKNCVGKEKHIIDYILKYDYSPIFRAIVKKIK